MYCTQSYLCFFILIMCYEVECVTSEKMKSKSGEKLTIEDEIGDVPVAICSTNKLAVKGYDVNISVVVKSTCFGKVKFIEVFALNCLYIDADFDSNGEQVQLSLIAPIWRIIGNRKIILNGKDGDEHASLYAPNGIGNFRNGRPGRPGVSAGQLLGIASKFIDESKLEIQMNGGEGGPGQHGGTGINGIDGVDPPIPANSSVAISLWHSLEFAYNSTLNYNQTIEDDLFFNYINIQVVGRNSTRPGDGGNGGVGGIGGLAGTPLIVGLKGQQKMSIVTNKGNNGIAGKGGAHGKESRSGLTINFFFRDQYNGTTLLSYGKPTPMVDCPLKSSGVDGIDGFDKNGIDNPDAVDLINPSHVINNYKSFVRSAMIDGQKIDTNFVEDIDKNERIQSLYDTLGFVDEMLEIETQYFQLEKEALSSYFTSLLNRMEELAQNFKKSSENKSVLTWLFEIVMMRLSTITDKAPIIDLPEYFNGIEELILKFRRNEIEVNVNNQQYSMNNEIRSVNAFIKNRILPELENILVEISSHVSTMIYELFERQYKFIPESDPCSPKNDLENDTTLSQLMVMPQDKMFPFKVLNSINALNTIEDAENEATDEWISDSHDYPVTFLKSTLEREKHSEKYQLFIEQLNDIQREFYQFSKSESNSLTNIIRYVANLKYDLTEQLENGVIDPNDVDSKRDELISLFENKKSELQSSKDESTSFDFILAILNLRTVSIDFYQKLSVEDITKLLNLYEMTNELKEEAVEANLEIENIYDTILEQYVKMEASVNKVSRQLIGKSHFELGGSKWRTMAIIRDVKAVFRKLGNDTAVMELLCRSIDNLDDTTTFLFETYDYIDHLNKTKAVNGFVDSALNKADKASKNLEKIIQMNVIIEKYGLAVKAFEKQLFPFANKIIMSHLKLPTDLQRGNDNNEKLLKAIMDRFYYLKDKVKSLDVLIAKYDRFVLSNIVFSSEESSLVGPFYTWKFTYANNAEKLKLLRGDEVELKATINMASHFHAVKFNAIGIKMIIGDNKQHELNTQLEKHIVRMTMTGKGDYLCYKKIHSFDVDDVTFMYSFKRNSNGQPVMKNDVYQKIDGKHYFLSPYTTWSIRIFNLSTGNLTTFEKDKIELVLFGRGQYAYESRSLSEACNELNQFEVT